MSDETVKVHRKNAYRKLHLSSQAQLFSLFIGALEPGVNVAGTAATAGSASRLSSGQIGQVPAGKRIHFFARSATHTVMFGKWCTRLDSNQWPLPSEGSARLQVR
ncbi:hypothetical protein [Puniceibacterium antarcticum]|uniref:hypothetical protein n=1 Tax=Puniceibacterium antarcticum TaxID=1206336 RepID=UPI001FE7DAC1|nr:hypothetical protein [Puniceibacterium antarcticum]